MRLLGDVHLEEPLGRDLLEVLGVRGVARPRRPARRRRGGGRRARRAPRRTPCASRSGRRRRARSRDRASPSSIGMNASGLRRRDRDVAARRRAPRSPASACVLGDAPCRATPPCSPGTTRRGPSRSARRSASGGRGASASRVRRVDRGDVVAVDLDRVPAERHARARGTRRRATRASSGRAAPAG